MRLSGDGKRVAFLMFGNGGSRLGLDGKIVAQHDSGFTPGMPITLSYDGSTLAYRLTDVKSNRDRIVILGRPPSEEFDRAGLPVLTRDGTGLAFWMQKENRFCVVIRGAATPFYDDVSDPAFSFDGATAAYATRTGKKWTLRRSETESPLPASPTKIFVAPDGSRAGAVVISKPAPGEKFRVVVELDAGEEFDEIGVPCFSSDGKRYAYRARLGGRWYLVTDSAKVDAAGIVSDPIFMEEGRSISYGAQVGRDLWWRTTDAAAPEPVQRFTDRLATVNPPERVGFDDIEPVTGGRLNPISGRADLLHRESSKCCHTARCSGARSPAIVDLGIITQAIDEFRRARREDPNGAAYQILVTRGNERFTAVLRTVLNEYPIYDVVFAKGTVRLSEMSRASGIPDLTSAILQQLR